MGNPLITLAEQLRGIAEEQEQFRVKPEICQWEGMTLSTDKMDAIKLVLDAIDNPDVEYWFHQVN